MSKVSGGHAVMIEIEENDELERYAIKWQEALSGRTLKLTKHVTLGFIGRDLDESVGQAMLAAANSVIFQLPDIVTWNGKFDMFGGKRDHMVAVVEKSLTLTEFQRAVVEALAVQDVKVKADFGGWNPHITLATGRGPCFGNQPVTVPVKVTGIAVKIGSDRVDLIEPPTFFPCGCSKQKVRSGKCDSYNTLGKARAA